MWYPLKEFQPTRPLRGATVSAIVTRLFTLNFNPRAPCGARRHPRGHCAGICSHFNPRAPCGARPGFPRYVRHQERQISTHAPLAGRDVPGPAEHDARADFNPRAPCGARLTAARGLPAAVISTHAPLAGRDPSSLSTAYSAPYFNPRAPCGARRYSVSTASEPSLFQPTRPLRGATPVRPGRLLARDKFQPTRPLRGATTAAPRRGLSRGKFQPTRPLRGATSLRSTSGRSGRISTHAPLAGRDDIRLPFLIRREKISTHAPLAGRDRT